MSRVALAFLTLLGPAAGARAAEPTYAQHLVDQTLAAHPELNALTFHVTLPNSTDNVIIASNIATLGKKADADDLSVIQTGKPIQEPNKAHTRFGVELQMKTVTGDVIGVVAVGFTYKVGDDTSHRLADAEALRDQLAAKIPSAASLLQPKF